MRRCGKCRRPARCNRGHQRPDPRARPARSLAEHHPPAPGRPVDPAVRLVRGRRARADAVRS
ncbi:EspF repeat-containing protein [Qipengyuania sp.]|uniref:EspF repeat-containing protein n=1 Tax=Qipengyuania sp. TaxID=2004515 RepID=UPI003518A298